MVNIATNSELDAFRQTIHKEAGNRIKWNQQYGSQQNITDVDTIKKTLSQEKNEEVPKYINEQLDLEAYMDREKPFAGLSGRFAGHFIPDYKNQFKTTSSEVYKQLELQQQELDFQHHKRKYWLKTYFENVAQGKILEKKKQGGS